MAKSTGKRQNELTPDEQQKDGDVVFGPDEHNQTCPAEGYVAGWTDWSDQEMAKSTGKRQNELTPDEQQKDGDVVFGPDEHKQPPSDYPAYNTNTESLQDSYVQSNEASSTDGDLRKGQQNCVNHDPTFETASRNALPF